VLDTKTHLSLARHSEAVNTVPVRLVGEEFFGATATLYLETEGGQEIRIQKTHEELVEFPLSIGNEFFAFWKPEEGHLVVEA